MKKIVSFFAFVAIVFSFAACGGNEGNVPELPVINGKFSVGNGQQVYFAKGNLQATTTDLGAHWTWSIAQNQYDRIDAGVANNKLTDVGNHAVSENGTVDLFGWSTPASYYGITPSQEFDDYSGNFRDWGETIGTGWYTLSADQWNYLFLRRADAKRLFGFGRILPPNAYYYTRGIFILPDNWDDAKREQYGFMSAEKQEEQYNLKWVVIEEVGRYQNVDYQYNSYNVTGEGITLADLEAEGVVFLPVANCRSGKVTTGSGAGFYWTSTPKGDMSAYHINFGSNFFPYHTYERYKGHSVRLVRNAN